MICKFISRFNQIPSGSGPDNRFTHSPLGRTVSHQLAIWERSRVQSPKEPFEIGLFFSSSSLSSSSPAEKWRKTGKRTGSPRNNHFSPFFLLPPFSPLFPSYRSCFFRNRSRIAAWRTVVSPERPGGRTQGSFVRRTTSRTFYRSNHLEYISRYATQSFRAFPSRLSALQESLLRERKIRESSAGNMIFRPKDHVTSHYGSKYIVGSIFQLNLALSSRTVAPIQRNSPRQDALGLFRTVSLMLLHYAML